MGTPREHLNPPSWWRVVLIGSKPHFTLLRILVLVTFSFFVFNFVLLPIRIQRVSMEPNYKERGVNFVNRLAYLFYEPRRGDVVAIRFSGPHAMLLKRIVGLPGETVGFHAGQLLINGRVMPESYVKLPCDWEMNDLKISADEYYVVCDNRSMAWADHKQGRASRDQILGKILL